MYRSAAQRVAGMWVLAEIGAGNTFMARYYSEFANKLSTVPAGKAIPRQIAKALKDLDKECQRFIPPPEPEPEPEQPEKKKVAPKPEAVQQDMFKQAKKPAAPVEPPQKTTEEKLREIDEAVKPEDDPNVIPKDEIAPKENLKYYKVDMTGPLTAASKAAEGATLGEIDGGKGKFGSDGELQAYIVCMAFIKARWSVQWPDPSPKINSLWKKFIQATESMLPTLSAGRDIVGRIDKATAALKGIKTPRTKTQEEQHQKGYRQEKQRQKSEKEVTPEIKKWWDTAQKDLFRVGVEVWKRAKLKDIGKGLTSEYFKELDKSDVVARQFRKGPTYGLSLGAFTTEFKRVHKPAEWKPALDAMTAALKKLGQIPLGAKAPEKPTAPKTGPKELTEPVQESLFPKTKNPDATKSVRELQKQKEQEEKRKLQEIKEEKIKPAPEKAPEKPAKPQKELEEPEQQDLFEKKQRSKLKAPEKEPEDVKPDAKQEELFKKPAKKKVEKKPIELVPAEKGVTKEGVPKKPRKKPAPKKEPAAKGFESVPLYEKGYTGKKAMLLRVASRIARNFVESQILS